MMRKIAKPSLVILFGLLSAAVFIAAQTPSIPEAPSGFNGLTNGSVAQTAMDSDAATFSEIEQPAPDGLGPVYNAVSCTDCHQSVAVGGASQVLEFRAGHNDGSKPSWFIAQRHRGDTNGSAGTFRFATRVACARACRAAN